jgi:RNA polymerase sigma-70 factor (ECF subfamily)
MENDLRKIYSDIYDQNIEKLYRFVFLKVSSKEIAEDITSEVFTRGWNALQNKNIDNPRAFLYQVARNLIVDHYRLKGRAQVVPMDNEAIVDTGDTAHDAAIINADLAVIKNALPALNDDYQTVLIWHYIDDMPISEISQMMGKSEGSVRVMLHRALNSLRSHVKES